MEETDVEFWAESKKLEIQGLAAEAKTALPGERF